METLIKQFWPIFLAIFSGIAAVSKLTLDWLQIKREVKMLHGEKKQDDITVKPKLQLVTKEKVEQKQNNLTRKSIKTLVFIMAVIIVSFSYILISGYAMQEMFEDNFMAMKAEIKTEEATSTGPYDGGMKSTDLRPLLNGEFSSEYAIDDIEVPIYLNFHDEKTKLIDNDSFYYASFFFSGRIESSSICQYLVATSENRKWKLTGELYKNKTTTLAFTKPNKTQIVNVTAGRIYTFVTITVAIDVAANGRLNPFGEPINKKY